LDGLGSPINRLLQFLENKSQVRGLEDPERERVELERVFCFKEFLYKFFVNLFG